jgi:uncharacterized cupin superfamily protein
MNSEEMEMPKIEFVSAPERKGSNYPAPFDKPCAERVRKALGAAAGLNDFGVNLLHLPPGAWSSQRHWHRGEDEFVFVVSGEVVLVSNSGEAVLRAGDCAGFPKGVSDGHHLINRSAATALCLEVGTRTQGDICTYSDIDMQIDDAIGRYARKDGSLYPQ